jgi:hypothetical protein
MERRHLQEKEKLRKEAAAKIRETKVAMAQLAGGWAGWGGVEAVAAVSAGGPTTIASRGCSTKTVERMPPADLRSC